MSFSPEVRADAMMLLQALPLLQAAFLAWIASTEKSQEKSKVAACSLSFAWLTLGGALGALGLVLMQGRIDAGFLTYDRFSTLMLVLIALLGLIVQRFSVLYMQADLHYRAYFQKLSLLIGALMLFATAQNVLLLAVAWVGMSSLMLALLKHQDLGPVTTCAAGQASRVFRVGDAAFVIAAICFVLATRSFQIAPGLQALSGPNLWSALAAGFLMVAALTKTANLPFFRWLPNTMTAPSTVSAIMHAGFLNSGAVLFTKFAGLYAHFPSLLVGVFVIGAITALFGAWAMLVQTDVKRYLAYSTIGQMGFMMMQCGLGAYSAAIFHLLTHSLFKSSLFLGSAGTIQKNRNINLSQPFHAHAASGASSGKSSSTASPSPVRRFLANPWGLLLLLTGFGGLGVLLVTMGSHLYPGAASILLLFPALALLPLTHTGVQHPFSLGRIVQALVLGGLLLGLYVGFEQGLHTYLAPHVQNNTALQLTGWPFLTVSLVVVVALFLISALALWLEKLGVSVLPMRLKGRIYVWLLNQSVSPAKQTLLALREPQSHQPARSMT